jgi:hypothetical protein
MRRSPLLAIATLCALASFSSLALSEPHVPMDPPDVVAARALFRKSDYRGALDALERAQKLNPSPRLFWNMAACENKLGHHAKAIAYVERYLAATSDLSDDQRKQADDFVRAANAYVGRVTITSRLDGVRVTIDDDFVGTTPFARPLVVDEGSHRVRFERAGHAASERTEQVLGGTNLIWAVELTAERSPNASAPPAPSPGGSATTDAGRSKTLPLLLGGAGVAVAITGGVLAGLSLGKAGDLQEECSPACPPSRWHGAKTMQIVGDVMLGVGGLAVAGAVVLLFLPAKSSAKGATGPSVALSPTLGGAALRGTW